MEIKRQVEAKKLKYPENIITYSKRTASFSGLLFFMISSYVEANMFFSDPDVAGGLQGIPPAPVGGLQVGYRPIYGVIELGLLTISIVSLITTITFAVKFRKLKKKNSIIDSEVNDENATNVEEVTAGDMLKRIKKKLIISGVVMVVSIITIFVLEIIRMYY